MAANEVRNIERPTATVHQKNSVWKKNYPMRDVHRKDVVKKRSCRVIRTND